MKFYGRVGYSANSETSQDVWDDSIIERMYVGDVLSNNRRSNAGESVNDNLDISNRISVVADAFAYEHFFNMTYVEWMGTLWKIQSVEVQRPRLILSLGGVYNGPTP
jgi:hypothetical protein